MPFNLGPGELILILLLALIILGPGKLPEVGSALGRAIREFRQAASDVTSATRGEPAGQPAGSSGGTGSGAPTGGSGGPGGASGADGGASGSEQAGQTRS
jgi:TatA/E family protein of Tat protein translocase